MNALTRPLVRYHGGKWRLADWIIGYFPGHRIYVEPFGGGGSILLRKRRSSREVYGDLDCEMVNLFKAVRDHGEELCRRIALTPFASQEFVEAWDASDDLIEQARRTIIRAYMGFGSSAATGSANPIKSRRGGARGTGFRSHTGPTAYPCRDWANYPIALRAIVERLQGVVIENRDYREVVSMHKGSGTLYYFDPPYVLSTRDAGEDYRFEMTDADHVEMAEVIHRLEGNKIVSGYDSPLYADLFKGWRRMDKACHADGARERIESLWLSPGVQDGPLLQWGSV